MTEELDPRIVDVPRYRELVLRAVHELPQPLGVIEDVLSGGLFSRAGYLAPSESLEPAMNSAPFASAL